MFADLYICIKTAV